MALRDKKLKKLFTEYSVIYFTAFFFLAAFLILQLKNGGREPQNDFLAYYKLLFFGSLKMIVIEALLLILLWFSVVLIVLFVSSAIRGFRSGDFSLGRHVSKKMKSLIYELKEVARIGPATMAILFFISSSLSVLNDLNKFNLKDEMLLKIDVFLTGSYPFVSLHSFEYPGWFVSAVRFSFLNLTIFMLAAAFYIFFKNKKKFREMASAFSLGMVLLFSIWIFVPALSPQDRYIDNVYELPVKTEISAILANYSPQKEIKDFLKEMREWKKNLKNMSTSTMPSAHILWASVFGYYIFKTNRLWGVAAAPLLILSSFGTFFLAQHYFVDVPAGVLTAAVAIFTTTLYFKELRRRA